MTVAVVALLIGLGESSLAAPVREAASRLITGKQVKDGSLSDKDLSKAARARLHGAAGPAGAQGPAGAPAPKGDAGKDGTNGANGTNGTNGTNATAPAGAVMYFNTGSCPAGWGEMASARGRYLVGLTGGGSLGSTIGTALSDGENRPVGQHTHAVTDPQHNHSVPAVFSGLPAGGITVLLKGTSMVQGVAFPTDPSSSGITVNNTGLVAGTNAPYLQLLVCEKN